MPDLLDIALERVRNRLWRRFTKACIIYACVVGFTAALMAPFIVSLACVTIPIAITAVLVGYVCWKYHRGDPVVIREASRLSGGSICAQCCYDIRGVDAHGGTLRCPECGLDHVVRNDGELRPISRSPSTPRLPPNGQCTNCKYSLSGVPHTDGRVRCPECGVLHVAWNREDA